MKKLIAIFLSLSLCFLSANALAHPGRTDKNGGHTCRTNCEKWGLRYGQYHYHNGGASSNGGGSGKRVKSGSSASASKAASAHANHSSAKKPATPTKLAKPAPVMIQVIAIDHANVYNTPIQNQYYSVGVVEYGTVTSNQGEMEGWSTLALADGTKGYVPQTVLTQYKLIPTKTITVQIEKGAIFNIPSEKGKVRGYFAKNSKVNAVGESGNWYFVSTVDYKGDPLKGFISKNIAW